MAYPTLAELRESDDLESESLYSDDLLTRLIAEFDSIAERARGVAFGPHTATARLRRRRGVLRFPHVEVSALVSATVDGATVSPVGWQIVPDQLGDLLVAGPTVTSYWPSGRVVATYTHGTAEVPPGIARACSLYVWREALRTTRPNTGNAYLTQNPEFGVVERQSTQNWDEGRFTGWLDVDGLLNQEPDRRPQGLV